MKTTRSLSLLALSLPFLLAAPGCAAPTEPDAGEGAAESTSQAIIDRDYEVATGDAELWHTSLGFCYLTRVSGEFLPKFDEFVVARYTRLYINPSTGRWRLSSTEQATARCSLWSDFRGLGPSRITSSPSGWMFGGESKTYLRGSTSLCFLSGMAAVKGHGFDGYDAIAQVDRDPSGAWWGNAPGSLWAGNGYSGQQYPFGNAMCVDTGRAFKFKNAPDGSRTYTWEQGQPYTWMMPISEGVCMLTEVGGRFAGGGESVAVIQYGGFWVLGGQSMQYGVEAKAQCVPYDQGPTIGGR